MRTGLFTSFSPKNKKGEHTAGSAQELRFPSFGIYHGAWQCILHQWVPKIEMCFLNLACRLQGA